MKRKLYSTILITIAVILIFQLVAYAASDVPPTRNNNVSGTSTGFHISSSGLASVDVRYNGYPNITSGATIDIVIKKVTFLWFTTTVVDVSYNIVGENYSHTYNYDVSSNGSGTYKCNVTYTISGSGGADDVIPFEDTASY